MLAVLLLTLLSSPSQAEEPVEPVEPAPPLLGVGLQLGVSTNDPLLTQRLVAVDLELHLGELLSVSVAGALFPQLDSLRGWQTLNAHLVDQQYVHPSLSPMTWSSHAALRFTPLRGSMDLHGLPVQLQGYLAVGGGVVHTEDDLELLQAEDEPEYLATASQTHLSTHLAWGLRLFLTEAMAVHLEHRRTSYTETIGSTTVLNEHPVFVQLGASWHLGRRP